MTEYVRYYSGEWSGLYIDGNLDVYGDNYHVDERISELLGVKDIYERDFLLGTNRTPARTVDQIDAFFSKKDKESNLADQLEQIAERLLVKAKDLRT
jgi:hypothetical protein